MDYLHKTLLNLTDRLATTEEEIENNFSYIIKLIFYIYSSKDFSEKSNIALNW